MNFKMCRYIIRLSACRSSYSCYHLKVKKLNRALDNEITLNNLPKHLGDNSTMMTRNEKKALHLRTIAHFLIQETI